MSDYEPVSAGGVRWLVGREWVGLFRDGPFAGLDALLAGSRVVKDLNIKKTWEVALGGRAFYVKQYKAGSWLASLKRMIAGSRATRELDMCRGLIRRGVATVPLAAAGSRGRESFVVVEKVPGSSSLDEALRRPGLAAEKRRAALFSYGRWARTVHDAGVWQSDFNPSNVLVSPGMDEFRLIDFEKMKLRSRLSEASRLKLMAKLSRVPGLSEADLHRILKGYVAGHREDEADLARIARDLERYAAAYAEGRASKLARACVTENRHFARFEAGRYGGHRRKPHPDLGSPGLEAPEIDRLAAGAGDAGYLKVETTSALRDWKKANAGVVDGEAVPLAVFVEKGRAGGFIVYRA